MKKIYILLIVMLIGFSLFPKSNVAASANSLSNDQKVCTGTWKFPTLYVGGKDGVVFAEATYEFDNNCNPVLTNETRLTSVPTWVTNPSQQPYESVTVEAVPASTFNPLGSNSGGASTPLTVNTCHIRTVERDVVHLDMIALQTDQPYSWDNIRVTLSGGSSSSTRYYSWWYQGSGPHMSNGYTSSQVAWARADSSYYCQGGPFCGGTPSYNITLFTDMAVDYQGGCGGNGTYSGSLVPAGSVTYSVWK